MVSRSDYTPAAVEACNSVLVELVHILGEVQEHMVLVGGLAPAYLLNRASEPHVGSRDIDLALDFRAIDDSTYKTIVYALAERGYEQDERQPFRFFRNVPMKSGSQRVEVDFMAGEYGGTGRSHRTQKVQDLRARKARGMDLVFEKPVPVTVEGELPGGGMDSVTVQIAGIVPLLITKGMALHDRMKEKDAYDIFYCVRFYPGGAAALADEFKPWLGLGLVSEGLGKIRGKFAAIEFVGPKLVVDFQEVDGEEEREVLRRQAFETIDSFLNTLNVELWRV